MYSIITVVKWTIFYEYSLHCFFPSWWLYIRQIMTNQEKDFHTLSSCPYLFRQSPTFRNINCGVWWQWRMLLGGPKNSLAVTSLSSQLLWQFSELPCYSWSFLHFRIVACCSLPLWLQAPAALWSFFQSWRGIQPHLSLYQ